MRTENAEMKRFNISIKDKAVFCEPDEIHVRANTVEDIAVCLDPSIERQYKLMDLKFDQGVQDVDEKITPQRLTSSAIVLRDDNHHSKESLKFSVELESIGNSPQMPKLDPIIVND